MTDTSLPNTLGMTPLSLSQHTPVCCGRKPSLVALSIIKQNPSCEMLVTHENAIYIHSEF